MTTPGGRFPGSGNFPGSGGGGGFPGSGGTGGTGGAGGGWPGAGGGFPGSGGGASGFPGGGAPAPGQQGGGVGPAGWGQSGAGYAAGANQSNTKFDPLERRIDPEGASSLGIAYNGRGSWRTATNAVRIGVVMLAAASVAMAAFLVYLILEVYGFRQQTLDPILGMDPTGAMVIRGVHITDRVAVMLVILLGLWAVGYAVAAYFNYRGYPLARVVSAVLAVLSLFFLVAEQWWWPAIVLGAVGTALLWLPSAGNHFRWTTK